MLVSSPTEASAVLCSAGHSFSRAQSADKQLIRDAAPPAELLSRIHWNYLTRRPGGIWEKWRWCNQVSHSHVAAEFTQNYFAGIWRWTHSLAKWTMWGDLVRFPDWHECHFPSGSGNLTRGDPTEVLGSTNTIMPEKEKLFTFYRSPSYFLPFPGDDDDDVERGWRGQWFGNLRLDEIPLSANTCR